MSHINVLNIKSSQQRVQLYNLCNVMFLTASKPSSKVYLGEDPQNKQTLQNQNNLKMPLRKYEDTNIPNTDQTQSQTVFPHILDPSNPQLNILPDDGSDPGGPTSDPSPAQR